MDERGMLRVIHAKVPLSEMFGYTTDIRSMTQGRGSVQMEFDHYEVVPPNVEKQIVESRKKLPNLANLIAKIKNQFHQCTTCTPPELVFYFCATLSQIMKVLGVSYSDF
jgi:hypothetical protein